MLSIYWSGKNSDNVAAAAAATVNESVLLCFIVGCVLVLVIGVGR